MYSYAEIVEQIALELKPHVQADRAIVETTDFSRDLGLDSVKVMEMMLEIEDRFDIAVPVNRLADVHTVGDLAAEIRKLLDEG